MGRPGLIKIVIAIAALLACLADPCGAIGEETPLVKDIEIRGLARISVDVVGGRISQQTGVPLSPGKVSADIKAIFGLGYFEDVRVEMEPFEGGIRLVYALKEKPAIRRVDVYGNEEIDDDKLREKITISPGAISDTVLVKNNADAIKALYEEKGYPLASVVPVVRYLDEGHVLLTFLVEEGPKVKVRDIGIEGNEKISDRKIKKTMKTSEWWIFSWFTSGGRYEKAVLETDAGRVSDLYFDEGYIQARVSEPGVSLSEDRRWLDISIEVAEGDRFRVSSVGFEGNEEFDEEELRENIKTVAGEVVSKKVLDSDVSRLTDMYSEKGYAMANVYPDLVPEVEKKEAKVVFMITEGEIFKVGRINISGNANTRDKVIRREIRLNEGDTFNSSLLKRSYQRVNNLNFFETVSMKPVPDVWKKTLDLNVEVKERSTGYLNVGVGYSSVDRFIGMVEVTQANLGGRGQYVKLKSELGSKSTTYELSYRDPWIFDREVAFDASVYNSNRDYDEYQKKSTGFSLGLGKRFWEYWSASASYGFEEATIYDVDETASEYIRDQEGSSITSSVSPAIARDTRDNYLDPHTGSRNSVGLTVAGLGGDNKFYKVDFDSTWLLPVTEHSQFSFRGRHSFAKGFSGRELPLYERYYVGGGRTIRGLRNIGPRDASDKYIGGTKRLIFNVDYIFPLVLDLRLSGEIFYDVGAAYDDDIKMRDTTGAGVRWLSPIGPIKLDWAHIIDPEPDEPTSKWEFTIGTFF